jgi:hypothetical protein
VGRRVQLSSLALSAALGCSSGAGEAPAAAPDATAASAEPEPEDPKEAPMRVLVTGFNDWKELGEPPNVWRCRDNPSCRLLLGAETPDRPDRPEDYAGPLVARLRGRAPEVEWRFSTMPVTWEAFAEVPTDVDVIVNVGLGVYDRFDALQLEAGAFNLRQGTDAAGVARSEPIDPSAGEVLDAPADSPIPARLDALAGQTLAGYEVVVAAARPENSYLCNETHHSALAALRAGEGRLREVYFLHIPHAKDGDYEALAEGVAQLVLSLVEADAAASSHER